MTTQMSSTQFDQDAGKAKEAAESGPVYISDDDRPTHVLLTYEAYTRLIGSFPISDLLGQPVGVEDIEFVVPISDELARPALFD